MSLLTICQNTADEVGIDAPASVVGNSDEIAKRLLRLAQRTGIVLSRKNWEFLIKRATINTVASEPQYDLEDDYRSLVPGTIWNQTTDQQVLTITPRHWGYEKSAVTSQYFDRVRMLGDDAGPDIGRRITIHPTPTGVETIVYEYYSKNWLTDQAGTTERSEFTADTDVTIIDEYLIELGTIWRFLKSIGQPYAEEKTEYDREVEMAMAQDGVKDRLHTDGNLPTLSNIPETGFGT